MINETSDKWGQVGQTIVFFFFGGGGFICNLKINSNLIEESMIPIENCFPWFPYLKITVFGIGRFPILYQLVS